MACPSCEALPPQLPFYSSFLHTTLSNPTTNSHATLPTTQPLTKASPKADKLALSCKPKAQNRMSTNPTHNPNATKLAPCHKLQRWRVQAAGLLKKIFTYFFISRLDKNAFFGYHRHFNRQQYEKSLKNFKIFSVTVVLYGAGQMGS